MTSVLPINVIVGHHPNTDSNEANVKPCGPVGKPQPLTLKQLNAQEQKEYMQRIKSGEAPFLLSNIMIRMPSLVACKNNGDEIVLETKLGRTIIFSDHKPQQVTQMFNNISKLLEAIEYEDYESMCTLQNWIKGANKRQLTNSHAYISNYQ
jgi:hypothetical protein